MALKIHWKAPLQAKGFFKIVEFVVAILCLSLAASYQFSGSRACIGNPQNHTLTIETAYPFYSYTLHNVTLTKIVNPNDQPIVPIADQHGNFGNTLIGQGAQLYVTWSVATLFYCIAATLVYMLVTANEELEKVMDLLVYADVVFHVVWVVFWFIASVDFAVQYNVLFETIHSILDQICSFPVNTPVPSPTYTSAAQAGIAVVFGFLSLFLWAVNIFWVFIDTPWYIQRKGNSGSYEATP